MAKRKTTEQFIAEARKVHGDKYDYSEVEYVNKNTKVLVICPEHGEFWSIPDNHIHNSSGCPECGRRSSVAKRTMTREEFIKKSKSIHETKYDYSKVEYINSQTPVCIICPIHGDFLQRPDHHLRGCNCPKCENKDLTTDEIILRFKKKHGEKYDYSLVEYVNSETDVTIICPEHGYFRQKVHVHLKGHGCPKCAKKEASKKRTKPEDVFLKEAKLLHGDKYDYSKSEYINTNTKITIICPIHGEFNQTPSAHLNGHGCPKCGYISGGQKNTKYDYNKCKELALTCSHKTEFSKKYPGAYDFARKNNWINEFFPINRTDKFAKIHFVYRFLFDSTNSVYVGRTVEPQKREKAHRKSGSVCSHSVENCIAIPKMEILFSNLTLDESKIKEEEMVEYYRACGYNVLNKAKCGINSSAIGMIGFGKLSKEYCYEKAKECKSKSELEEKYQSVYLKSLKNGWLKDYDWFAELIRPKGYWDIFENVEKEAKKYNSRWDFGKNNRGAYNASLRNGWMDILFPRKK